MTNYQDSDTFWHDKPCIEGKPRSNNRLTYTAYSKYLAPVPSREEVYLRTMAFKDTVISFKPLKVNRLPDKQYPPMSKDEIITAVSLGLISAKDIEDSHWNFCNLLDYEQEKLTFKNVYKAVMKMREIRKQAQEAKEKYDLTGEQEYLDEYERLTHRNYLWQENVKETYCLLFYLPPWDQYYVKKYNNERAGFFRTAAFYANAWNVIKRGDRSSRMLLWLQLKDLNHWLLRYVDEKQWVQDYFYFDLNHPFVKKVLDNEVTEENN